MKSRDVLDVIVIVLKFGKGGSWNRYLFEVIIGVKRKFFVILNEEWSFVLR